MRPISGRRYAMSEAIFGSAARGESDALSDRDYLIVDEDPFTLRARCAELEAEGWSVASYTFGKLQALHSNGALFIQHLKGESCITRDSQGRLQRMLRSFKPKLSYESEIIANADLSKLISTRPDCPVGHLWACDVLYVTVRNFGILRLAESGLYNFAYSDVIEGLVAMGVLPRDGHSALSELRLFKSLYRSGEAFRSAKISEALDIALSILPRPFFPPRSRAVQPLQVLATLDALGPRASAYHRLRNLEKGLAAACAIAPEFRKSIEADRLKRWIENPRAYAGVAERTETLAMRHLRDNLVAISTKRRFASR